MTIAVQSFANQDNVNLSVASSVVDNAVVAKVVASELEIQAWLTERIARYLNKGSDDIDITLPFSFYGLDSVAAIGLSGELEEWLRVKLPPTLTWDFPTIQSLACFLAGA